MQILTAKTIKQALRMNEQRPTNLLKGSRDFSTAGGFWTGNNLATVTANTDTDANGNSNAEKMTDTAGASRQCYLFQLVTATIPNNQWMTAWVAWAPGTITNLGIAPNGAALGWIYKSDGTLGTQITAAPFGKASFLLPNAYVLSMLWFKWNTSSTALRLYMTNLTNNVLYTAAGGGTLKLMEAGLSVGIANRWFISTVASALL